jgi:hypothetical protein
MQLVAAPGLRPVAGASGDVALRSVTPRHSPGLQIRTLPARQTTSESRFFARARWKSSAFPRAHSQNAQSLQGLRRSGVGHNFAAFGKTGAELYLDRKSLCV